MSLFNYDTTYLLSTYVYTYTIILQCHSMELAAIWRGKLIGSYMTKIQFE